MKWTENQERLARLTAAGAGIAVALLGGVVMLGWTLHSPTLIQVHPDLVPMQFNTALGFLLGGALLMLPARGWRQPRLILAGLVSILGATTLCEYASGYDLAIDRLFPYSYITTHTTSPGRMAITTALGFTLTGASSILCSFCSSKTARSVAGVAGTLIMALATLALIYYALPVRSVFVWDRPTLMAVHTAAGFVLLGGGLLAPAFDLSRHHDMRMPPWFPAAAGIWVLILTMGLWQALHHLQTETTKQLGNDLLLAYGVALALVLGLLLQRMRQAKVKAVTALHASRLLGKEFAARLHAEKARRESEAQLRQAQKLETVGQLTGGIAHDFNNTLGIVSGNLELLESRLGDDAKASAYLNNALRGVQRGASLTQKLLAFSRRQVLRPEVLDLNKAVRGMTELLQRTLGETIKVETVCAAGLWPCHADRSQLENALLNLSLNARDAIPGGGILTVETGNVYLDDDSAEKHADSNPGQYVMLAVSDNGTGMSEATRKRVFEPFFTTKESGKGSGLGLSMVHGFVTQSGGRINLYSEPGNGTSIKLYFPRYRGAKPEVTEPPGTSVEPGGNETVLVVEDESALLQTIVAQLRQLGYTVRAAHDMTSALAVASGCPGIDLLLTDVVLPGGNNGRDVATILRTQQPDLNVLYMSGYTKNAIDHHGRLDDDVMLLAKPFTREELGRMIRRILDGRQQLRRDRA